MTKNSASLFGGAGCLLAACIWGFAFVIVKDSLDYVSAVYMMAFRFTMAAFAISLIFIKKLRLINRQYLFRGLVLGAFMFIAYAFQTIGCNFTTAGKNAFLTTTYVILVPFFAWTLYRERPHFRIFIAAVIELIGIGFLSLGNEAGKLFYIGLGDLLTLISGIFYAFQIVFQEKYCRQQDKNAVKSTHANDPIILTILAFIFAAIFSWIAAPFYDGTQNAFLPKIEPFPLSAFTNTRVFFSLLYLGLLSTMLAFLLQNICLKYVPSPIASLLLSLESVFGMLFSILIPINGKRENVSVNLVLGCILIFSAIAIAELRFSKGRKNK